MRNTQCITKCYLDYLCYSHEVEKTERLRVCKVKKSKKRPHVTRICVLHKVVDFAIFLGSLRISIFTLLEEIENERVYPEIVKSLPLNSRGGFGGYVVDYAVYALNLVYYAAGGGVKDVVGDSRPVGGHKVAGHNRS